MLVIHLLASSCIFLFEHDLQGKRSTFVPGEAGSRFALTRPSGPDLLQISPPRRDSQDTFVIGLDVLEQKSLSRRVGYFVTQRAGNPANDAVSCTRSFPGSTSNMRTLIIGNGDGIGLALTRRLLGDGEAVVGVSRRAQDSLGDHHSQHVLDVLNPEFPEAIAAVVAQAAPIDTLVYCAGRLVEFAYPGRPPCMTCPSRLLKTTEKIQRLKCQASPPKVPGKVIRH